MGQEMQLFSDLPTFLPNLPTIQDARMPKKSGLCRHITKPVFPNVGKPHDLVSISIQLMVSLIFLFIPIQKVFTRDTKIVVESMNNLT
jgi:hypothetical protein